MFLQKKIKKKVTNIIVVVVVLQIKSEKEVFFSNNKNVTFFTSFFVKTNYIQKKKCMCIYIKKTKTNDNVFFYNKLVGQIIF